MSTAAKRSATPVSPASERTSSNHSLDHGYTTDEASDSASPQTYLSSSSCFSINQSHKSDLLWPSSDRINLKTQQVSEQIRVLHSRFHEFCDSLIVQDGRVAQLRRQNGHCLQLLHTFEDFLQNFEEETAATVYCGNWFAQLILLKEQLNEFDTDSEQLINRLNDKMEHLFDYFVQEKNQLLTCSQSLANLEHVAGQLEFVARQISKADLELSDIVDYVEVQVREQRNQIVQFVQVMSAIANSVEATIVCNDIAEFDCFAGQHFLVEFHTTLNHVQII